jgi:homocysteine S-methyltransferase
MSVPDYIRKRMHEAGEHGLEEGVAISIEMLEEARPLCRGAYLMPPFNRFEMAGEILEAFPHR